MVSSSMRTTGYRMSAWVKSSSTEPILRWSGSVRGTRQRPSRFPGAGAVILGKLCYAAPASRHRRHPPI